MQAIEVCEGAWADPPPSLLSSSSHSDVFALVNTAVTDENPCGLSFVKVSVVGDALPEARGWFASASLDNKVLIVGGLNGQNERLGDAWTLELVSQ